MKLSISPVKAIAAVKALLSAGCSSAALAYATDWLMLLMQRELGGGFVFICHAMATVETISHRVTVLYTGGVVETGPHAAMSGSRREFLDEPVVLGSAGPQPLTSPGQESRFLRTADTPFEPSDYVLPDRVHHQAAPGHMYMQALRE